MARQAVESGSTLLLQPVRTDAVSSAATGATGTTLSAGYLGGETIAAYAPLDIPGLDWVIVAEIDSAEAFAPVDDFTRNLVLSSAVIVLVVSLLSLVIAGVIVRPLRRLRDAARKIAAGEVGVQVDAGSSDELADVGAAFNDMSRSLQVKAALLEEQQEENERLLLAMMPESLVKRYKEGARTIALDHQEVTVMFGDIEGFEAFSQGQTIRAGTRATQRDPSLLRRGGGPVGHRAGPHDSRGVPGQLWTDDSPCRQRQAHGRLCDRAPAHPRAV